MTSALDPGGVAAAAIARHAWMLFGVGAGVWVAVMLALGLALVRRGRLPADEAGRTAADDRARRTIAVSTGLTVITIFGLLLSSLATTRAVSALDTTQPLFVHVVGHQYWWELRYGGASPSEETITANELHLPTGRPVVLELTSQDVIHSFWVPSLHGKMDLIPGHHNRLTLRVDRPGAYRGQCAEFCGYQHAHMGMLVIAESPAEFERWLARQRLAGVEPAGDVERRGRRVLETRSCGLCHTVRGSEAGASFGPDLTHVASRRQIAAGLLPNTHRDMARWITDPQHLKPGSNMPATPLAPDELDALVRYLGSLT